MKEHGLVFFFYICYERSSFLIQVLVCELIQAISSLYLMMLMPRHTLISIQPYRKHTRLPRKVDSDTIYKVADRSAMSKVLEHPTYGS